MQRSAVLDDRKPATYSRPRPEVISLVPADARRILDLGCGDGSLAAALCEQGAVVLGVDVDSSSVDQARRVLSEAHVVDLDEPGAIRRLGQFDAVICADILEHLRDPWRALDEVSATLRPGGSVVLSIPNVQHATVALDLLFRGRWEYTPQGLLDITHLRFFTERSARALIAGANLMITDFVRWPGRPLPARILGAIAVGPLRGLATYQFLVRATPRSLPSRSNLGD